MTPAPDTPIVIATASLRSWMSQAVSRSAQFCEFRPARGRDTRPLQRPGAPSQAVSPTKLGEEPSSAAIGSPSGSAA